MENKIDMSSELTKVWNGLVVIICSHIDGKYGKQRSNYIRMMVKSILDNKVLPERIIISYTELANPYPNSVWHRDVESFIPEDHPQKNRIDIKFRGHIPISQMNQLLITSYELSSEIDKVLLLDDDDLISSSLISEYQKEWNRLNQPEHFVFETGLVKGYSKDIETFSSEDWKEERDIFGKILTENAGTIYSLDVLKFFFKRCLVRGVNLNWSTTDFFLKNCVREDNYFSESPEVIDISDKNKIYKSIIEKPLYFYRKWRDNLQYRDEDIQNIIKDVKTYGLY